MFIDLCLNFAMHKFWSNPNCGDHPVYVLPNRLINQGVKIIWWCRFLCLTSHLTFLSYMKEGEKSPFAGENFLLMDSLFEIYKRIPHWWYISFGDDGNDQRVTSQQNKDNTNEQACKWSIWNKDMGLQVQCIVPIITIGGALHGFKLDLMPKWYFMLGLLVIKISWNRKT